jgi:hypothetical protein
MVSRTSITAVASSSIDNELLTYRTDSKAFNKSCGLDFWITEESKFPLLAPLVQDLLSAPASEAYVECVFSVCGDLTMGKRNRLTKSLEQRTFLKVNYKYYA